MILRLGTENVFRGGMDRTATCIVKDGMTPRAIMSAMWKTGVCAVVKIGTVLGVPFTVFQGSITPVTSGQGAEYVFQDGRGGTVTRRPAQ